mgnify:CR=1 FL=1
MRSAADPHKALALVETVGIFGFVENALDDSKVQLTMLQHGQQVLCVVHDQIQPVCVLPFLPGDAVKIAAVLTFGNAIKETAPIYPDVLFFALDVSAADFGDWEIPANVYSAVYQEELSGYMAGYAAVKLGYKHLGYLGGMAVPAVQRFGYGYLQGIDAAAKELGIVGDIKVEYVYGNQFYGDADITAVMDTWYGEKGVEVVFACGGGIFTSAAEAAAKVEGAKVIGVDTDQAAVIDGLYGEGLTVTSALKGLAPTVKTVLSAIVLEDNWAAYAGKIESLGLVSADPEANYVQLPMESTQWSDTFTQEDYKALVAGMFDGTIAVSGDIAEFPVTEVAVEQHPAIKG